MTNQEHPTGGTETRSETLTTEPGVERGTTTGATGALMYRPRSRVAWGAVFAGALVAFVIMSLLNLLGLAIGAIVMEPGAAAEGIGIGAGVWWTISAIIALFVGGWIAGHFSDSVYRSDGLTHGVVTWSLFTVATFLAVMTTLGQLVAGVFGVIGQNLVAALTAIQPQETLEATLAQEGIDPAVIAEAEAAMAAAGETALDAIAIGAGWAFIALLLGGLACAFGGSFGTIEEEEAEATRRERLQSRLRPRRA